MSLELSNVKFLDVIEQKARTEQPLTTAEKIRLNTMVALDWDDCGTLARVERARQKIVDKITSTLVGKRMPRYLHTFSCPRCNSAWSADGWAMKLEMACPNTKCGLRQASASVKDRGMRDLL